MQCSPAIAVLISCLVAPATALIRKATSAVDGATHGKLPLAARGSADGASHGAFSDVNKWYAYAQSNEVNNPLNFKAAQLSHNNLGGLGPDGGEESMVLSNIAQKDGSNVDMVISVAQGSDYHGKPALNLLNRTTGIAQISLQSGTKTRLRIRLVDQQTRMPVHLPRIFLSILDIDAGSIVGQGLLPNKSGGIETNAIGPVDAFYVSQNTGVHIERLQMQEYSFRAMQQGGKADNPTEPLQLTAEQGQQAVMAELRNASDLFFTMEATAGKGFRNVLFTGSSNLLSPDAVFGPCFHQNSLNLAHSKLLINNLDGHDKDQPAVMHFTDVLSWNGSSVDLTVSVAAGTYLPPDPSMNTLRHGVANINMASDGIAAFLFILSIDGTPVAIPDVFLSFSDIDAEGSEGTFEALTIASGKGTYFLSDATMLASDLEDTGFMTFTARDKLSNKAGSDKDTAVTFHFSEPVDHFKVFFGAKAESGGRNVGFGAEMNLACPST